MKITTVVVCVVSCFLSLTLSPSVHAERSSRPGTSELREALGLLRTNRCEVAIPLLRQAWELGHFRNAQWNLAVCYTRIGRPRQAIEAYRNFAEHSSSRARDRAEANTAIERLESTLVRLNLGCNVTGAQVRINGIDEGASPLELELGPGQHTIEVTSPGFSTWQHELLAESGNEYERTAQLELLPGTVAISSDPGAAEVWIDGERREGSTPWEGELSGGRHQVELRSAGHRQTRRQVLVQPGQRSVVNIVLLPAAGTLAVATNVSDATLRIDGDARGQSPFQPISVIPGRYLVQVEAPGYGDYREEIDIVDSHTTRVQLELNRARPLQPAGFWTSTVLSVALLGAGVTLWALGGRHEDIYNAAVSSIEGGSNPLENTNLREDGQRRLELERSFRLAGGISFLVGLAGALTSLVLGFFTRFREGSADADISVEASLEEEVSR